uniref:50S ribosomal protein 5ic-like n=1 Tax=Rhizophora mucronata TaxID=61149 RepID=A0A2P2QL85_RHIMU
MLCNKTNRAKKFREGERRRRRTRMGLYVWSFPAQLPCPSPAFWLPAFYHSSSAKSTAASSISSLQWEPFDLHSGSHYGLCLFTSTLTNNVSMVTVKALSEVKGMALDSEEPILEGESMSESDNEEDLLPDKLPLDSKLQQKLEHKMKMKLGKKIRLRRKKLDRKRRMRKRGKWPPLKVNKLKNV